MLSIKELAKKYNLNNFSTCNCGGYQTEKYSDGVFTLSWRKHRYLFQFRKRNEVLIHWTVVANAEKMITEFYEKIN